MTFGKRRNQISEEIEEEASSEEEEAARLKINLGELLGGGKPKDPRIIGLFESHQLSKVKSLNRLRTLPFMSRHMVALLTICSQSTM